MHVSPSTTHVRAYVAVRDECPSGTHSPTPDREEVPQPSPSSPQLDGNALCQYQMDLRDLGEIQWEMGTPVWMTRKSPSQEGGDGNPEDNCLDPLPPQPDEDVGHLINTLATRLQLGTPHINTFSGKATPGKTEVVSFEQWYHEVQCIKDHYPELVVQKSIVRSLKGAVADIAWYIGLTTSVAHILKKNKL